ncbi:unnamed protein product [Boreogadus saida]
MGTQGVGLQSCASYRSPAGRPSSHGSQGPELAGRATPQRRHYTTLHSRESAEGAAEGGDVMLLTRDADTPVTPGESSHVRETIGPYSDMTRITLQSNSLCPHRHEGKRVAAQPASDRYKESSYAGSQQPSPTCTTGGSGVRRVGGMRRVRIVRTRRRPCSDWLGVIGVEEDG